MSRRDWWLIALLVAILALAASANSIPNDFTYDDVYIIQRDARAQTLAGWWTEFASPYWLPRWGGDGYRPMTRILFRLEWALGTGSPAAFHATNVALHVVGSIAVLWLAGALLPMGAAAIAAGLYAVHPVHTEAIANVVGQSELAVGLLLTLAVGIYLYARRAGPLSVAQWTWIGVLYAIACFFKEHAIVLPALLIAAELTVVPDRAPARARLARLRLPVLLLTVVALGYLFARTQVLESVSGFTPAVPFQTLKLTTANRILTMIGAAPEWLRLLLWPARLMTDYSPPYIDMAEGPSLLQLPGALLLVGLLGLIAACWRRSPVTSFGLLWLVITLLPASNFIIPAGILLAERTLLLPSVGAMIALSSAVPWLYERVDGRRRMQVAAASVLVLLIALGIGRSVSRNRDWKDNETIFHKGVADVPNSYRLHFLLANHLFETGRVADSERHFREALRLFPYDPILPFMLAERYRARGVCGPAIQLYRWSFELGPYLRYGETGLAGCLLETMQLEEARTAALNAIRFGGRYANARRVLEAADAAIDSVHARRTRGDTVQPSVAP
ncbi:MAG TPA: tetratricopeptide repeat protein [Gemmatimonadaceae bacterium]|nr:tetratricopeptide repeat protein [Gemmatimonadaceae bacterium]